ncbi:MAG: hypothetical protein FOGNACKC_05129 [Anaerolineae bacterium]|nr:hypothetical protein [Anaerolineae bacterium]
MTKANYVWLTLIAVVLAACSANASAVDSGFNPALANKTDVHLADAEHDHLDLPAANLTVVLVPTELVAGPNRFAVGLFDAKQAMLHDAAVHFRYFDLSDPGQARPETEADARRLQSPDGLVTIFAQERNFDRVGDWGVEIEAQLPDGSTLRNRVGFRVAAESASLTPGEKAPAIDTPTLAAVNRDLSRLTSARQPNPALYQLSLAEAVTNGKPTLLLFATPEFCQTRFCGPAYETFNELQNRYGDQLNFIHVEVFAGLPNPANYGFKLAPAVEAFGLSSDPWLYLLAKNGNVLYRVEGLFTAAEIEQQLQLQLGL